MTISPSARHDASFVFDTQRFVLVLFGGKAGSAYLGDTWEFNLGTCTWVQIIPTVSPPARASAFSGWDPARNVLVVHAGQTSTTLLNDTWEYVPGPSPTWTQITTTTTPPAAANIGVGGNGGLVHSVWWRRVLYRFGGWNGTAATKDFWMYDGLDWTPIADVGAAPNVSAPAVGGIYAYAPMFSTSDFDISDMLAYGGGSDLSTLTTPATRMPQFNVGGTTNAFWSDQANATPGAVRNAVSFAMQYNDGSGFRDKLIIVSGIWGAAGTSGTVQTQQWEYGPIGDVAGTFGNNHWVQNTTAVLPTARSQAAIAYGAYATTAQNPYLFGGLDAAGADLGDMWFYDGTNWLSIGPAPRTPSIGTAEPIGGTVRVIISLPLPSYPATSYTVTASNGSSQTVPFAAGQTNVYFTGLTNGVAYTFTVTANNAAGSSAPASIVDTPVASFPDVPQLVTAVAGNASSLVSWQPPLNDGGSPITGYDIAASYFDFNLSTNVIDASVTVLATQLSVMLTGLQNDRQGFGNTIPDAGYNIGVSAINTIGTGSGAATTSYPTAVVAAPTIPIPLYEPKSAVADDLIIIVPIGYSTAANTFTGWAPTTAASGIVSSTADLAQLTVRPVTGSAATLTSNTHFQCADVQVNFNSAPTGAPSGGLASTSGLAVLGLDDGAGSSAYVARCYDAASKMHAFECTITVGGVTTGSLRAAISLYGALRIIAANGYVYLYAQDGDSATAARLASARALPPQVPGISSARWQLIGYSAGWPTASTTTVAFVKVWSDTENISTQFTNFISAPGIMFGIDPVVDANILPTQYAARVPPSSANGAGLVDLTIFNETGILAATTSTTTQSGFTYATGNRRLVAGGLSSFIYLVSRRGRHRDN